MHYCWSCINKKIKEKTVRQKAIRQKNYKTKNNKTKIYNRKKPKDKEMLKNTNKKILQINSILELGPKPDKSQSYISITIYHFIILPLTIHLSFPQNTFIASSSFSA